MTFDGVARLVMSKEAHGMLGRIAGMSLLDDERYPIGADRVRALNAYLRERAAQLLELEPRSDDNLFAELERLA